MFRVGTKVLSESELSGKTLAIRGRWNAKGDGQKAFVKRTGCTVETYIERKFASVRVAVQKAKQWSGDENS
jgi:hypothetical protein